MNLYYVEHLESALFFGAVAILLNWIAFYKNFYDLPEEHGSLKLSLSHVLGAFSIYLVTFFILTPFSYHYIQKNYFLESRFPIALLGIIQLSSAALCFFFSIYFRFFYHILLSKKSGKTLKSRLTTATLRT